MNKDSKALVPTDEEPSQDSAKEEAGAARKRMNPLPLILAVVVLSAVGAASYYGYQLYLKQQGRLDSMTAEFMTLKAQLAASDESRKLAELESVVQRTSSSIAQLPELRRRVNTLEESVQASHDLVNRAQRDWVIAEVDYLIRIANQRLRLMRDYNGAIAALQAADQRLRELADPSLMPVREALADDVQTLKDFERPDLIGIALRLDRLISHLKPLPLDVPALNAEAVPAKKEEQPSGLAGMLSTAWQTLSERVTVRHYAEGVEALPDQEGEMMLHQILRLRLEAARVDVLRQDDHDYHLQLQSALDMLDKYYQKEQALDLRTEIAELNAVNLRPELPDITRPLKQLQRLTHRPVKSEQAK